VPEPRHRELGLGARVEARPFIDNMASADGAADLVTGRAGALTLAELAIVGKPAILVAILVPLPTATDLGSNTHCRRVPRRPCVKAAL
jgi:UDP-N-acetylglucosamine--N-acetylmuramyl-(pentapeptide) pyrophosphoryl-undecaprenol N-acetylglucosamine transferase